MATLWQDIRYGLRMLWKNRAVSAIVILALALGIGANTAIFSVVNAALLRPLPYSESDRLVFLHEKSQVLDEMSISYPNFLDWRTHNQSFEKIGVYNRGSYNLTGTGEVERLIAGQMSADIFTVLRVNALHGRVFTNDEDKQIGRASCRERVQISGVGVSCSRVQPRSNARSRGIAHIGRSMCRRDPPG